MLSAAFRFKILLALELGLIVVFLRISAPATQRNLDWGTIDGVVVYENGGPVKGATVRAIPLGRPLGAMIPHAETDDRGHFGIRIPASWFGKFAVAAEKQDEDYADMTNQFYSDGKFDTVTLSAEHPDVTMRIEIGPKAAALFGTVTDSATHNGLSPCVGLRRASEPNNYLTGSGLIRTNYKLLLPPGAGIRVKIWLDGYRPWYFPGTIEKSAAKPAFLRSGEEMRVDIALQPDPSHAKSGCPAPLSMQ